MKRRIFTLALMTSIGCAERSSEPTAPKGEDAPLRDSVDPQREGKEITSLQKEPLRPQGPHTGPLFETHLPEASGLTTEHPIDTTHPQKYLYYSGTAGGGVALGDVDGDDLIDVFIASGPRKNGLFRQVKPMVFEEITHLSPTLDGGDLWSTGAAFVDLDADGDLDLYVGHYDAPNHAFINDGTGRFTEQGASMGLDLRDATTMPYFADYDGDGDLDVYLLTYRYYLPKGRPAQPPVEIVNGRQQVKAEYSRYLALAQVGPSKFAIDDVGRPDRLLRNDDGRFVDVSAEAGIDRGPGHGLSAVWWDFDADGDLDLYVANDFDDPDHLYRNAGDGTFTDVKAQLLPHTTWYSMGSDAGDLDNDGRLDLIVADMSPTTHYGQKTSMGNMGDLAWKLKRYTPPQYMRNAVFVNTGSERFAEYARLTGMGDTDWTWAVKIGDVDLDGRADVYFTNGVARTFNHSDRPETLEALVGHTQWDLHESTPTRPERNLAFHNQGGLRFESSGQAWGLDHVGMSYAAAWGDLDKDGDLDLVGVNLDGPVRLYENHSRQSNRIVVRLRGQGQNTHGLGATVRVITAAGTQTQQLMPTTGFMASDAPHLVFGLGAHGRVQALEVDWPSGRQQRFTQLSPGFRYTVTEPARHTPALTRPIARSRFAPMSLKGLAPHQERPFDDFDAQPLLPNQLSQLGPALALGDVDGNGRSELFVGGAAGRAGQLFRLGVGPMEATALDRHIASEDMGALWLDADSDGDQDLLVVSGGVESAQGSKHLVDRLYLNDNGTLDRAVDGVIPRVPDHSGTYSGGGVAAADFDGDGDLDLFIGGRVQPGRYPLAPVSQLLRNDGGLFTDVTDTLAPDLRRPCMVTGALWSDADDDGDPDLWLTCEWGPIKLFENKAFKAEGPGELVEATTQAGLADLTGWWNGITSGDVDGDGDMDYVVTNFGLNTKYHASKRAPARIYYGKFDKTGADRLVEAEFEDDTPYTIRGRSCLSNAIPSVREKYDSFEAFAQDPLDQVFAGGALDQALSLEARTLESGVLINEGSGRFTFSPLPHIAQGSPAFGTVLTSLDGDAHLDLVLAQNFFGPQIETGRMDGGVGLVLQGDGKGGFEAMSPADSGLMMSGDATALVVGDFNRDQWPDLLMAQNDGPVHGWQHQGMPGQWPLVIALKGPLGNLTAVGARVTVHVPGLTPQTQEIHAGHGYLSQSSGALFFGGGRGDRDTTKATAQVRWPDGTTTTHEGLSLAVRHTLEQP
ncbi:MAG: FG-GAP-like repeat-containing protein [Bradymonadia bacterium]